MAVISVSFAKYNDWILLRHTRGAPSKIDFNYKKKATVGGVFVSDCIVGKFPQTAG